jgi:hypothetical protein
MHVSASWGSPFTLLEGVDARPTEWGLSRTREQLMRVRSAWRIHRAHGDVLLITAGSEVVYLAALSMFSRRWLAVYDFLQPTSRWLRLLARLVLWRVDRWAVVRSGDIAMLHRRFGVRPQRCSFVPFPAQRADVPSSLGSYVYAAGTAYRDWRTFLAAMDGLQRPTVIAANAQLDVRERPWIESTALVSPAEGRRRAANARLVVAPMLDTDMPSGPVVVIDAMAAGKAVIASDVNGTRDYIRHGETGWLVPPGDAAALRQQIEAVIDDEALLGRVGDAASAAVLGPAESFALLSLHVVRPGQAR